MAAYSRIAPHTALCGLVCVWYIGSRLVYGWIRMTQHEMMLVNLRVNATAMVDLLGCTMTVVEVAYCT